jgi:YggT family protein
MGFDPILADYWAYHLVNYVLAAVMYTMFGRALLGLFVSQDSPLYIMRGFRFITDPFIRLFAGVTPRFIPPGLAPLYVAFLLIVLRLIFWALMYNAGLTPSLDGVRG